VKTFYFDTRAVVAFFGGPAAIEQERRALGMEAWGQKSISKCMQRGSIPIARLLELQSLADHQGRSFSVNTFIKENNNAE
jgi:hypothetical protein